MAIELPALPQKGGYPELIVDPEILAPLAQDAAAMKGDGAVGLFRPEKLEQLQWWLADHHGQQILVQGALSSLTGGATPNLDVVIQLKNQKNLSLVGHELLVGAQLTLHEIQEFLFPHQLFFPPAPTYDGATIGGAISTNAAGASTFKYGTTRDWILGLKMVLRSGHLWEIKRGDYTVSPGDEVVINSMGSCLAKFTIPHYQTPALKKISCGYYVKPNMDLIDLFIGSEGTLAIVVEATLKVEPRPEVAVGLSFFKSAQQAIKMVEELRTISEETRKKKEDALDVKSIECFDDTCLQLVKGKPQLAEINLPVPADASFALLYEIEVAPGVDHFDQLAQALDSEDSSLKGWNQLAAVLKRNDCLEWTEVAFPSEVKRQKQLALVRESIPMAISEFLTEQKKKDAGVHKVAGDFIVPFDHFAKMLAAYYEEAKKEGLQVAVFGHISDGNVHPNILPQNANDVARGKMMFERLALISKQWGGAPMSEHGVGKHPLKKKLLALYWGDKSMAEMRAVKKGLDPLNTLGKGIYFDE